MKGIVQLIEGLCIAGQRWSVSRRRDSSSLLANSSDFVVGNDTEEGTCVRLGDNDLSRHLYVTGATGTGKTNFLLRLIDHIVEQGESLCLIDLRGDLLDLVLGRIGSTGDVEGFANRLHLIDLREERLTPPFNPLAGTGPIHARAYGVLAALKGNAESWGVQLDEVLRNGLLALAECGYSLTELPTLLANKQFRRSVAATLTDPTATEFFERFESLSAHAQANLASPVLNKVTPFLALPPLRRMLGSRSGILLSSILEQRGSILLISLAAHRLKEAARLAGSLILAAVEAAITERADLIECQRHPVYLVVDEFENFASSAFLTLLAEGRRYGGRLVLAHQNLSQLSKDMQDGLRSNAHLQLYFQTGANDAATLAKEVSGLGKKEKVQELLKTLPVGQALFTVRSQPTLLVETPRAAKLQCADIAVETLKAASTARWASLNVQSPSERSVSKEVRHGRKPRL